MKRFYIAIILFTLPIFVFMGGAEYAVRQIPNEYKYKNDWMDQHADEVETLIMGSSHAWFGINPEYINGLAFNLAFMSQSLKYDSFLLHKWGDRYKKLKLVIVPISYSTFYFDNPFGVLQAPSYYRNYMDCPYYSGLSVYCLEVLFFKALHGKLVTQKEHNWQVLCNELGWHETPVEPKEEDWDDSVKVRNLVKIQTGSLDEVEKNYSYLKEMALFCKEHNIGLVLVSIPMSKAYNDALDDHLLAVTYSQVRLVQKDLHLDYFDYREDSRFCSDDFADVNHLNKIGAEKFTKILMNDMFLNDNIEK